MDKHWDWWNIFANVSVDAEQLLSWDNGPDPDYYIHSGLSENKSLTRELVNAYPNKRWDVVRLLHNKIKTLEELSCHFDNRNCNANVMISMVPHLQLDEILKYTNINWYWTYLSEFLDSITIEQIEAHPELPWDWNSIGRNPRLLEVSDKECEEAARALLSANKIKRQFKRALTDPSFIMCRKRLQREFFEMV